MPRPKNKRKNTAGKKSAQRAKPRKMSAKNPSKPRRKAHAHKNPRRRPRKNPVAMTVHRRRRRNPNFISGGFNMLKQGLYALVGLVLTRQLPQLALSTNNVSWMGYAANMLTMFVIGFVGHKALGTDAGNSMMLGGGLYVANRIIGDFFSPIQQYLSLSGMGDPMAVGKGGGRGLRGIVPGYFPLPVPTDAQNNPIIPMEIRALPAPTPAAMATTASGGAPVAASVGAGPGRMSGVGSPSGRFGGRF